MNNLVFVQIRSSASMTISLMTSHCYILTNSQPNSSQKCKQLQNSGEKRVE